MDKGIFVIYAQDPVDLGDGVVNPFLGKENHGGKEPGLDKGRIVVYDDSELAQGILQVPHAIQAETEEVEAFHCGLHLDGVLEISYGLCKLLVVKGNNAPQT